jgi:hypothetical protein
MEQAAPLERLQLLCVDPHLPADVDGDLLHPVAVLAGERVAFVHGLGEGADGLREHVAHLDKSVVGDSCRPQGKREQESGPPRDAVHLSHQPRHGREGQTIAGHSSSVAYEDNPNRLSRSESHQNGSDAEVEHKERKCSRHGREEGQRRTRQRPGHLLEHKPAKDGRKDRDGVVC